MELLQLRYFLVAAQYQHMTKAAEHLQIAQPALSQAIHRLEAELGVPLFERKNRSIELNDEGKFLQKRLIPILSSLDRLPEELRKGKEAATHTVHLRLLSASALITNRIIAYRSLRPDVNFQLYQAENHSDYDLCVSAVRSDLKNTDYEDDFDVCVTARRADTAPKENDDATVMLEEDLYLAVPSHSPYGSRESIRLTDTKDADYICLGGSKPIRQITNSYFMEAGFTPHIIFESDTTESVRNLIAAGMGIGFWPACSWGPLTTNFGGSPGHFPVKLLPITDQKCRRQIILTRSEKGKKSPIVADFCDFLVEHNNWL